MRVGAGRNAISCNQMAEFRPSIFVSATSHDLRSYRKVVTHELVTGGCLPIVQEHFPPDYRRLIDFLEQEIQRCDAVICLVGPTYGATPEQPTEKQRSYTQIEYDVARKLGKKIYVFLASVHCKLDHSASDGEKELALQRAHVAFLLKEHKCSLFSSKEDLRADILKLLPEFGKGMLPIRFVHLPQEPAFFAGREFESDQLTAVTARRMPCLVAVVGIGGQGKTTLVSQWLKARGREDFAAVFWCTAYRGGFTFDMFVDEALGYLLLGEFQKRDMPDISARAHKLLGLLQDRPALFVIDGIERWLRGWNRGGEDLQAPDTSDQRKGHFEGLDDFLSQASSISNGTHIIFTTRALPAVLDDIACAIVPVDKEGHRMELQGLDDDSACRLLQELGVRGEREQFLTATRPYLNHPLAVTVLGGLLVKKYGGRIEQRPHVSALDPKRRLFELFEETRQNLPGKKDSERFLQVVSLFVDNPTLEALAAVLTTTAQPGSRLSLQMGSLVSRLDARPFCQKVLWFFRSVLGRLAIGENPPLSQALIEELRERALMLADWRLIQWDSDTNVVRLHPLIKDFFAGRTRDSLVIHRCLSEWYLRQPIDSNPVTLVQARPRLLAIEHALNAGDLHRCMHLMFSRFTPQYSFSEWLAVWGHLSVGIELLDRLANNSTHQSRGAFLLGRSAMLHQLDRPQQATEDLDEAITIFADTRDQPVQDGRLNLARALSNRGNIHRETSRSSDAVKDYDRAIGIFEGMSGVQSGAQFDLAKALMNRGNALWDLGHWSRAVADYDRTVAICQKLERSEPLLVEPMLAFALANRGITLADMGHNDRALSDFEEALARHFRLQNSGHVELIPRLAYVRILFGTKLSDLGRLAEAVAQFDQSILSLQGLVDAGRQDVERLLALAWMDRAQTFICSGRLADAVTDCDRSISLYERLMADRRPQLDGSLAHALLIRAEARYMSADRLVSAADRAKGFAIMRHLMTEWSDESDICIVFLQKALRAIKYLLPVDTGESASILNEVLDEVDRCRSSLNSSEGLQCVARRVLASLDELAPALQGAGIDISRIRRLTELTESVTLLPSSK